MSICETKVVAADYAKLLRTTANFSLQRPMSESNTMRLEAEMLAGRFVPGTPIYFGVLPDKSLLALNGNHTLDAIARAGKPIELTFIYQDVKDQTEAAAIYSRLDLHKLRSWRDSLRAFGAEDMLCDSTAWTAAFAASIGFLFEKFRVARNDNERELARIQALRSRDVRLRAMHDAQVPATHYVQAVSEGADLRLFKRASVMAVGIEVFRYQVPKGVEFFKTLAADDGLRQGEPQRALLRYLREHSAAGAVAREAQARAVALAWNAFYTGRKLDIVKPGAMGEFRIDGTPWTEATFDPLRSYLPDLFVAPSAPIVEPEPTFLPPEPEQPKSGRRRRIQAGVDAASNRPVTIFDADRITEPADAEG